MEGKVADTMANGKDEEGNAMKGENWRDAIFNLLKIIGHKLDVRHKITDEVCLHSRQITWESKRCISTTVGHFQNSTALMTSERMLRCIFTYDKYFMGLAKLLYAEDDKDYYYRFYSSGLQEMIEALTLLVFVKEGRLITYEEVVNKLNIRGKLESDRKWEGKQGAESVVIRFQVPLTKTDFYLGIADVPGELVRLCATGLQTKEFKKFLFDSYTIVRALYQCLYRLVPFPKGMVDKLNVMRSSLCKLETACYHSVMQGDRVSPSNLRSAVSLVPPGKLDTFFGPDEEDSGYD